MPGESGNSKELLQAMEGQSDVSLIPDVHSKSPLASPVLSLPWLGGACRQWGHPHPEQTRRGVTLCCGCRVSSSNLLIEQSGT